MRRVGLEPTRPKAVTGSLVLRVCQFRHPRYSSVTQIIIATVSLTVNTYFSTFFKKAAIFFWYCSGFVSKDLACFAPLTIKISLGPFVAL